MTNSMKRKLRRLMGAINGALSESEEITQSLEGVRQEGYDLYLVLEASVVMNGKDLDDDDLDDEPDDDLDDDDEELKDDDLEDDEFEGEEDDEDDEEPPLEFRPVRGREVVLRLSPHDMEFLKALRIRCD